METGYTSGEGERMVLEVESYSRPGVVYRVQLFGKGQHHCPCLGHHHAGNCRHVTEARIKTAPYRVEHRHNSIVGGLEYAVVEQATGRVIGFRPCYGDAFGDLMDLTDGKAA